MGKGKAVDRGFAGTPVAAEVVVATETASRIFDFKLKEPEVAFDTWDIPKPYTVKAIGQADLQRAVKRWKPQEVCRDKSEPESFDVAALCLTSIWASWQGTVQTQIAAALPMHQGLRGNLSALEIRGSSVSLGEEKAEILENKGGYLVLLDTDGERQVDNGYGDYLTFETASDDLQGTPTALSGTLVLRLSRHIEPISLPLDVLGREAEDHGMRVTYVGLEDGAVRLRLDGPRERLVQFIPFDAAGTQRATNAVQVDWDDEAKLWEASFRVDGRPARVDIVVAVDQQVIEYDFDLEAPKSE